VWITPDPDLTFGCPGLFSWVQAPALGLVLGLDPVVLDLVLALAEDQG
jgi:hypothetical protein